ncbi:hypothetical protein F2P81_012402 [Scophthalmus maximus]|uniref:C-type lectin domain-containing protein n=1 Tax=Scophthalmus maximus TaxID=52904 RepID=A0A6A4SUC6_SCOMX|nr:hypothetical protein F2P81_012402 [Scophthalmus maximus]
MKKSAFVFFTLTGLFKVVLCAQFGLNVHVPTKMTWSKARDYCREHHTDLSSINSQEEYEELFTSAGTQLQLSAWIGLYRDAKGTWKWSGGGAASYLNFTLDGASKDDNCVALAKKIDDKPAMNCEMNSLRFYCFQSSLVLVKENKTWEEAMEHCRRQDSNLVSLTSGSALTKTLQTIRRGQTDHVWTGLRYLAGSWLWVAGDKVTYQAWSQGETPQCPNMVRHCGALSVEEEHWVGHDCTSKLNFVCH